MQWMHTNHTDTKNFADSRWVGKWAQNFKLSSRTYHHRRHPRNHPTHRSAPTIEVMRFRNPFAATQRRRRQLWTFLTVPICAYGWEFWQMCHRRKCGVIYISNIWTPFAKTDAPRVVAHTACALLHQFLAGTQISVWLRRTKGHTHRHHNSIQFIFACAHFRWGVSPTPRFWGDGDCATCVTPSVDKLYEIVFEICLDPARPAEVARLV